MEKDKLGTPKGEEAPEEPGAGMGGSMKTEPQASGTVLPWRVLLRQMGGQRRVPAMLRERLEALTGLGTV